MERAETWAFPRTQWDTECVGDSSASSLLIDLYDRERVPLQRYLFFLGIDPETARDVVQDAFLKLHEHLLGGGDQTNLRAWLYRVAHNSAQNRRSAAHASKTRPMSDLVDVTEPGSHGASPERLVLEREEDDRLRVAMLQLSNVQRECLVLRAQGFRYREIGEVLQLSTSTVAEHVGRGIEQLRKIV